MELMKRDGGVEMEMEVASSGVPGSLEWLAKEIYGSEEQLVEAMVGALASQGRKQVLAPKQRKVSFTTLKERAEKEKLQGGGK